MHKNRLFRQLSTLILALTMVLNSNSLIFAVEATNESATSDVTADLMENGSEAATEDAIVKSESAKDEASQANEDDKSENESDEKSDSESAQPSADDNSAQAFSYEYSVPDSELKLIITADKGVLPEGATAKVEALEYDDVQDKLDEALADDNKLSVDAEMFDVVLYDKDGNMIQPEGKVQLAIENAELDIPKDYAKITSYNAYRINDDDSLTVLKKDIDVTESEVKFDNDHFTAVGIVAVADAEGMLNAAATLDGYVDVPPYEGPYKAHTDKSTGFDFYTISDKNGDYIAYCYNYNFANPNSDGTDGMFTKPIPDASGAEFYKLASESYTDRIKPSAPYTTDGEKLKEYVLWCVYAGYPYKQGDAGLSASSLANNNNLRKATQRAIWYFTDYHNEDIDPTSIFNGKPTGDYAKIINYALDMVAKGEKAPIILDLFPAATAGDTMQVSVQNMLVTRVKEGETPTPKTSIKIAKIDEDGAALNGAVIQIIDSKGAVVKTFTSGTQAYAIDLEPGKYKFHEEKAPDGYETVADFTFEVNDKGVVYTGSNQNVILDKNSPEKLSVVDDEVEVSYISIHGEKHWNGDEDYPEARPNKVHIALYQNGTLYKDIDVSKNASGKWTYEFTDLPEYDESGNKYVYSVQETNVPDGYQSVVNGYDITNNYTPEKIAVQVTKAWDDANNQDGIRSTSVTVKLYANGVDTKQTKTLSEANNWSATFADLEKRDNAKDIVYTVKEVMAANSGYTSTVGPTVDGEPKHITITNKHTPEKTSVTGTKKWNDANNQDGNRPASVTVELIANGVSTGKTITTTSADGWKYSFTDLDAYANGQKIVYTVEEVNVPEGYQSNVNGYDITNSYTPGKVAVRVEKAWDDNNNQDGLRTNDVTVYLYANGKKTDKSIVLNEANKWQGGFDDLDEKNNGQTIQYTVKEETVNGYAPVITSSEGGKHFVITNVHKPATTSVAGKKTWDDAGDQDGKRPSEIYVNLLADNVVYRTVRVTEADNWSWKFDNLPVNKNGVEIKYTVEEVNVPEGYQSQVNGYNITNAYTPNEVSVRAKKVWVDNNNQDGVRPNSVTVHLYADGEDTGETVVLNEGNGWEAAFTNLPENRTRVKIQYTLVEDAVEGYTTDITKSDATGNHFTITNTHTPEVVNVSGTKTWNDANNQDGKRPESVEIILKKAGQPIATKTVTEDDGWTYSFDNLPKYESNGTLIRYSVQEGEVAEGYQSTVSGYNITNNYTPGQVAIQVAKSWVDGMNQDGIRPNSVTVHLFANGTDTGKTVILNAGNNWIADFENLPEYENGKKIKYTVTEDAVAGYNTTITQGASDKHFTITNTHTPELTSIKGTKIWNDANDQDGNRPKSVEIILKKAGQPIATKTITEADGWKYSFTDLPKYENNGTEIRYTVQEGEVAEGYQSHVNGYDITNSYTPGKVAVQVAKSWKDNDNQDGKRPGSVTVRLLADGAETGKTAVLNKDNNWFAEFTDLDEKSNGKTIVYTVTEDAVPGYTTTITQGADVHHFTVTNSHTPEITSVEGTKTWDDGGDQDGKRPDSVTIILKKAGQPIATKTVTEADSWKYSFTNLPKYENNGKEIRYSVEEADVPEGYQSKIDGYDITNSYTPGKIAIQVAKSWQDDKNISGIRPRNVKVWLYKNGVETDKYVVLNAGNNWTANFDNLDEYENGKQISYTVREESVKEYQASYETTQNGKHVTITNTYTPEFVNVSVEKLWDDRRDTFKTRPASIRLAVYQEYEGEYYWVAYGYTSEADDWKYTFEKLPKYVYDFSTGTFEYDADGKKVEAKYVIKENDEDIPAGYLENPTIWQTGDNSFAVENKLDSKEVPISKTDIGGKEIDGAKLTITDANGNVVESWTSNKDEVHVAYVPAGTYTLTEITVPDGYEKAESIKFTVDEDGEIQVITTDEEGNETAEDVSKVTMVDGYSDQNVTISKTDIAGSKEIAGAELVVSDENGNTVDNWTSEADESHDITVKPGTYVLTETTAPKGYKVAESIKFKVNEKGEIQIVTIDEEGNEVTEAADKVVMKDDYADGKVVISKTDVAGSEIEGAKLEILDKDGKVVESWTSEAGKNHNAELYPGTYTLKETTAPNGYEVAESITFTVDQNSKVTVEGQEVGKVQMVDAYSNHEVLFSKTDIAGKELKGATIRLLDKDGNEIEKWKTKKSAKKFKLQPGTYTFEETAAPEGYEIATSIRFTVNVDGTITSDDVTLQGDDDNMVVMVDAYKKVSDKKSEESDGTPGTGDDANVLAWVLLLVVASGGTVFLSRKRRSINE